MQAVLRAGRFQLIANDLPVLAGFTRDVWDNVDIRQQLRVWIMAEAVVNNRALGRYELAVDGSVAIAEYRISGQQIIFHHTVVPPALEGRGVGRRLVMGALDDAEGAGLAVVAECWFVAKVLAARG